MITTNETNKIIDLTKDEFHFKPDVDMEALSKEYATSMSAMIKSKPENVKCKGIRIYYVDTEKDVMFSAGLFVDKFSPEDWDDK
jgi:hypothetical protein